MKPGDLILVPTDFERDAIGMDARVCGAGVVAAAVIASRWIRSTGARRVILGGFAGSLDPLRASPGSVVLGTAVAMHGIGAGALEGHIPLEQLGFALGPAAGLDCLPLAGARIAAPHVTGGIVTVAAVSDGPGMAALAARRLPGAIAEDMETAGVAFAARDADVPLVVLRGISNLAGDREKSHWRIDAAAAALRAALEGLDA